MSRHNILTNTTHIIDENKSCIYVIRPYIDIISLYLAIDASYIDLITPYINVNTSYIEITTPNNALTAL